MLDIVKLNSLARVDIERMQEAFAVSTAGGTQNIKLLLKTSNSDACKEGEVPVNHFVIDDGNKLTDVGKSVPAVIVSFRPFALDWGDKDNIIATADHTSDAYKKIHAVVKQNLKDSKCLCGPEFLVYLPTEGVYANLLMAGWTAKSKGAQSMFEAFRTGKPVTITAGSHEGKHGKNFFPIATPLSTQLDMSGTTDKECTEKIISFLELTKPTLVLEEDER